MSKIYLCAISNIQSGACGEDCSYCAQSAKYQADIEKYTKKEISTILEEAKRAKENKAIGFCLVSSGKGLNPKRLDFVCRAASEIKKLKLDLKIIACNGIASKEDLLELKKSGVDNYNHNLETSKEFYPKICTTHSWEERLKTCLNVKEAGLGLVCGGIFGLGESIYDRISLFKTLSSLEPMNVPLNFYHPNPALPLKTNPLSQDEAFEIIKLAKKMIPKAHKIMIAGGRELMFNTKAMDIFKYGANAIVIGDYLTTKGASAKQDIANILDAGHEIAQTCDS